MRTKREKKQRTPRPRSMSLNLILWFTFVLFAIAIVVVFTLVQSVQLNREYRTQTKENLKAAAVKIKDVLLSGSYHLMPTAIFSVANEYGVSAYLFTEDEHLVYPEIPDESRAEELSNIIGEVKKKFEEADKENDKRVEAGEAPIPYLGVTRDYGSAAYFAAKLDLFGEKHYICCTSSFEILNRTAADMNWYSLITALFAVALAFVVSGFVSMIIAKPVTAVTERAKELARGNYELGNGGSYFCTEVSELSHALDYASSEISKADKMQKELIANVSHDFKTPLTMIKAYAAMIKEISGEDPEKREKHTSIIIEEADRLTALVNDLLDLSRLRAGIDSSERTVFNLTEDVYRVAGRFGYLTETDGYTLETEIAEDVYTYAGKTRVEQVLYNLIGNAFNYTGEDKKVVVRLVKGERAAHFEVIDSGKGIPPEELDTIWERYYRSSEAHKRPVRGTGLGLSIVKGVLLHYNIPFGVQSEQGKGSCFWVDFPYPPEKN